MGKTELHWPGSSGMGLPLAWLCTALCYTDSFFNKANIGSQRCLETRTQIQWATLIGFLALLSCEVTQLKGIRLLPGPHGKLCVLFTGTLFRSPSQQTNSSLSWSLPLSLFHYMSSALSSPLHFVVSHCASVSFSVCIFLSPLSLKEMCFSWLQRAVLTAWLV